MAMGRPRAFDMDQALDSAMELFWRKGYEGASVADLTKAMGINPPSLYAAFGNKEGLFRRALDRYAESREGFIRDVLQAPTAREAAERMLMGTADTHTDPCHPPGCLLIQGGLACGEGADAVPEELAARREVVELLLQRRFVQAAEEGDLPPGADPESLARYVSTMTQGMAVQAAGGATRDQLRKVAAMAMCAWPVPAPTT